MGLISAIARLAREIKATVITDGENVLGTADNPIKMAFTEEPGGAAGGSLDGTYPDPVIAAGALSADAPGRAMIADDYFNAATVLLKIADAAFAADTATRALFADGIWTEAKLALASLTGAVVAVNAAANVIGSIPVEHRITIPAGATGDVDVTLTHKTFVTDVHLIKTTAAGGGAGTITVKNGATAITDAISIDIADKAIARASTIDDASNAIAAAGTLRITRTRTASSDESCIVIVRGLRVA